MKRLGCDKDFEVKPLSGLMDVRSQDGSVAYSDFRLILNVGLDESGNAQRLGGWKKFHKDSPFGFKNQDLHDQITECLFYNETFEKDIFFPSSVTGYSYPYWFPNQAVGSISSDQQSDALYYGYAPDYYGTYPETLVEDQWRICFPKGGFPYDSTQNYSVPNTGYEDYYQYPYFSLCLFETDIGYNIPGYSYGDQTAIYSDAYTYTYEYCGDYLYYRPSCREPITLMMEATSNTQGRRLIAGTNSRIYLLNEKTGNWRVLADGLGGPYSTRNCQCIGRRFKADQLGDTVFFVNGIDPVMFWDMDSGASGCNKWSAQYVPQLQGLGVTSARVIGVWQGFVFIGDLAINGESRPGMVMWSDFNSPLEWAPGGESLSGLQEFSLGEKVLAIEKIGGQLRIYTSRGKLKTIYEVVLVGGDEVFRFNQVYSGPDGIEYPNSMINTGDTHVWLGPSGIMSIGEYDRTPVRQEWLHKSSGVIYKGIEGRWVSGIEAKLPAFGPINQAACEQAVGGYDPNRKVMWFSWPTDSNVCPNMTMTINPMYGHTSLVDHGFTSFLSHKPDYKLMVREMMAVYGGCDIDLEMKEGEPYEGLVADSPPAYLRNETEDINLPVHEDSLCARLQDVAIEELCASCEAENKFLMASAEDFTIKEFTPTDYVREAYVDEGFSYPCPQTTPGSYTDSGYVTLFQRDPSDLGSKVEKLLTKVLVDFTASPQTTPNSLFMEAGSASQPGCMRWEQSDPVDLSCLTDATDAEHETDNTRADEPAVFQFYSAGIFLAWRMYLEGTGGGSDFSSATMSTRLKTGEWR